MDFLLIDASPDSITSFEMGLSFLYDTHSQLFLDNIAMNHSESGVSKMILSKVKSNIQ